MSELEMHDAGDKVVMQMQQTFIARETGRSASMRTVEVYEFQDDLVSRIDVFYKDPGGVNALFKK